MKRLHPDTLAHASTAVARPAYDRSVLRLGIVHLGLGAFARAHLAPVNEAAMQAGQDWRWGICGVSLRQPDTRDALQPQDGLYTLAIRDVDASGAHRQALSVIGALRELLVAPEDPEGVLARIAHPDTRIVSITVTEKGYCHDPATGALRLDHPDIIHDLAHPGAPRSIIGFIVHGLQRRHARLMAPVTLMSLDNLPANGKLLRGLILDFAHRIDPALHQWIATACTFPCSMVDRIVPRTTDDDRRDISRAAGLDDAWPVLGEPFLDWVIEDDFAADRPDWREGGARFVPEAQPYELLKLRMVNGTHSALAYLAVLAGWHTVDVAIAQPLMRAYIAALMRDEIAPTLPAMVGMDLAAYGQRLLQRYANPALKHQTRQIAMDGSQKLPQRLLGTIRERLTRSERIDGLALAVAGWLVFLREANMPDATYVISDPLADALKLRLGAAQIARGQTARSVGHDATDFDSDMRYIAAMATYAPVFGELGGDARFVRAVAVQFARLGAMGVAGTLVSFGDAGADGPGYSDGSED